MQNFSKAATDNDSFRTDWPSGHNPKRPVAPIQTGQSAKSRFLEREGYKAVFGDLTQSAQTVSKRWIWYNFAQGLLIGASR
jgi:hypothetical protein